MEVLYQGDTNNVVGIVTLTTWDLLDPSIAERPLAELVNTADYVVTVPSAPSFL